MNGTCFQNVFCKVRCPRCPPLRDKVDPHPELVRLGDVALAGDARAVVDKRRAERALEWRPGFDLLLRPKAEAELFHVLHRLLAAWDIAVEVRVDRALEHDALEALDLVARRCDRSVVHALDIDLRVRDVRAADPAEHSFKRHDGHGPLHLGVRARREELRGLLLVPRMRELLLARAKFLERAAARDTRDAERREALVGSDSKGQDDPAPIGHVLAQLSLLVPCSHLLEVLDVLVEQGLEREHEDVLGLQRAFLGAPHGRVRGPLDGVDGVRAELEDEVIGESPGPASRSRYYY